MKIQHHTFQLIDWKKIKKQKSKGLKGKASAQVINMGDIRIRIVEYSAGYVADHWCNKGHVIYCISGRMISELKNGKKFTLKKGMTYKVGDNSDPHRSSTKKGCRLFIVD
jgi:quercetin dioxygenase-like cupin family protein